MSNFLHNRDTRNSLQAPTIISTVDDIPPKHTRAINEQITKCFAELLSLKPEILNEVISSQTRRHPLTLTIKEATPRHKKRAYEYNALCESPNMATKVTFRAEGTSNESGYSSGEPTLYIGTELLTISRNVQASDGQPNPSMPSVDSRSQRTLDRKTQYEILEHLELNIQTELPKEVAEINTLDQLAFRHSLLTITTSGNFAKLTFPRQQNLEGALAAIDEHFGTLRLAELLPEAVEVSQNGEDLVITNASVIETFQKRIATFIATGELERP